VRLHAVGFLFLSSLASGVPAFAQQYVARQTNDVVRLEDTTNQTVVSLIPSVGNIAYAFTVKGHNVLRWPYASVEDFKAKPGLSALPFLGPWMGRLDEQAKTLWTFKAGTKLPDGVTVPAQQLFPNPDAIPLRDYNLDDGLTDFVRDGEGRAHFVVKGTRQQLDIMFGANWNVINIWSPNPAGTGLGGNAVVSPNAPMRGASPPAQGTADPNFIAFEPMASLSNGLNLAQKGVYKEQQYVRPGATWTAIFWVKPSGF
jgi:galactose mutarotase-like enzyme